MSFLSVLSRLLFPTELTWLHFFLSTCQPFYGRYKFHRTPKTSDGRAGPTYWRRSHSLRLLSSCTEDFNKASARKVLLRSLPHISCPMQGDNLTMFTVPSSRWTVRSRPGPAIGRISEEPGPLREADQAVVALQECFNSTVRSVYLHTVI